MTERKCQGCGEANPADAQFCIDCGVALTGASTGPTTRLRGVVCPVCYSHNPDGARFCASCGRSFEAPRPLPATQPRPTPAPRQPPPMSAPRQSYPRTATPPQVPYRLAPPARHPHSGAHQNPGPIVFLIGLAILMMTGAIWPGVLVLIGLSALFNQLARGQTDRAIKTMFLCAGLALFFGVGHVGGGGLIALILLMAFIGKWGGPHRRVW